MRARTLMTPPGISESRAGGCRRTRGRTAPPEVGTASGASCSNPGVPRHHGAHLDRAVACRRDLGRPGERVLERVSLDQVVAAELLFRLGERAVGRERLTV